MLEVLLPQRGALANARAAVEHDRSAERQRRQVALALALARERADQRAAESPSDWW